MAPNNLRSGDSSIHYTPMSVRVKICGITNLQDAIVAVEAGADYLGFILWPGSKRAVEAATVAAMSSRLRQRPAPPLLVGVFVNEDPAVAADVLSACRLDLAQLSGEEPPAGVADPASPLYGRAYKALRPATLAEAEAEAEWYAAPDPADGAPALLLDTYHPTLRGGTGATGDWAVAARVAAQVPRLMLAGGLTPHNVASAVRQVQPYAVDVASGVEASPGRKDPSRVRAFIATARSAQP
ncbi:MAG: phosphoribosylanthranilate isomerase [Anaerolineae bacterium]|nr:phosphoribosylanthranilate isomerase [Anaerolineae bacterium]